MSSIGTALLDILRSVERPGDFCVGGIRDILMPTIDVDGVGGIAFPILPDQAERLIAIAEGAPYGRGEETVVDRDVRRTWQVDSAKVRIGGRHWEKTLAGLVTDIALRLGVSVPGRGRTAHEAAPVGSGACVGVGTLTLHSTEQRVRPQNEPEEPDATC